MSNTITLGKLIEELEQYDADTNVQYDFCGLAPREIDSWRGSYSDLALDFYGGGQKVGALLEILRAANGRTYTGYKGGEFLMSLDTPVWVDDWGQSTCTGIVGVRDENWRVILETAKVDF